MAKRRPSKKTPPAKSAQNRQNGSPDEISSNDIDSQLPKSSKSSRRRRNRNEESEATLFDDLEKEQLFTMSLRSEAQTRYLNYSLSVITSRALPDVRDGLKPVQRRILYTMDQQGLNHTAKFRKSATVVGEVMGKYHPHGDSSIYEAMVRMAQPFSLRAPLVDGSGNFGSIDGDNAAAMRYTECRLTRLSSEVLVDLNTRTVDYRVNYDGSREEPVVLPSRVPNLLLNGATGIAVGMATNIPPHNLKELCLALLKLLKDPEIKPYQLVAKDAVQGPDFPTGGQVINTKEELRDIYAIGQGAIRVRGTSKVAGGGRGGDAVLQIVSIPFAVNKANLVERISELVYSNKMSLVSEVRDVSTDDIRIDLVLKKGADPEKVLAFLYKNTQLQTNFNVNLTCLVPTENPLVGAPARLGLKEILWHFLHFRLDVVTRRLENEMATLNKRIHILRGFVTIFDALDEIIQIIRRSEGKSDAAEKIMKRFPYKPNLPNKNSEGLDAEQTDAILELKLYRLARLEINLVNDELKKKIKRANEIDRLLKEDTIDTNHSGRWQIVRAEIESLIKDFGSNEQGQRRTILQSVDHEPEYTAEDFIVAEDCHVMITADGWIKRQRQISDPEKSRLRQGDSVLDVVAGSTRATIGFFSSLGVCYTTRMTDIPASTGFGEPIQKLFKLKDGERIVSVISFDSRVVGEIQENPKKPELCPETHGLAATSNGFALRFGLEGFAEVSTRNGRRFARVAPGSEVVAVYPVRGLETILAISQDCRAMVCSAEEINYLTGAGKGVTLIKLAKTDRLLGFKASTGERDLLVVETNRGAKKTISTAKYRVTSRGGRGTEIQKNGKISTVVKPPIESPPELKPLKN